MKTVPDFESLEKLQDRLTQQLKGATRDQLLDFSIENGRAAYELAKVEFNKGGRSFANLEEIRISLERLEALREARRARAASTQIEKPKP